MGDVVREKIIAKRYARGLFELALESGDLEQLEADMTVLDTAVTRVPLFIRSLEDERITLSRRMAAAAEIARELGLCEPSRNALLLLLERKRMAVLGFVARDVIARIMAHRKLAHATAAVADEALTKDVKRKVEEILGQLLKLKVKCDVTVEPELIGGFLVRIGDRRYDASVAGELDSMKQRLLSVDAGGMKQEN